MRVGPATIHDVASSRMGQVELPVFDQVRPQSVYRATRTASFFGATAR